MAALLSSDPMHSGMHEGGPYKQSDNKLGENGGRWYFSRKENEENSPSRSDGIGLKETYLHKSCCTFLQDLGMRLKVCRSSSSCVQEHSQTRDWHREQIPNMEEICTKNFRGRQILRYTSPALWQPGYLSIMVAETSEHASMDMGLSHRTLHHCGG